MHSQFSTNTLLVLLTCLSSTLAMPAPDPDVLASRDTTGVGKIHCTPKDRFISSKILKYGDVANAFYKSCTDATKDGKVGEISGQWAPGPLQGPYWKMHYDGCETPISCTDLFGINGAQASHNAGGDYANLVNTCKNGNPEYEPGRKDFYGGQIEHVVTVNGVQKGCGTLTLEQA